MEQALLEQETRRQAMLQVMGMEVWLPRQPLPHAAPTPGWLLDWQPDGTKPGQPAAPAVVVPAASGAGASAALATGTAGPARVAAPQQARAGLQQVRQALTAQGQSKPSVTGQPAPEVASVTVAAVPELATVEEQQLERVEIPRFSLQLLRSGPCLLLVDLPLGEAFQTSDPDFQLLLDILRAAGLPQPQLLRRGEPVRWPLLSGGALAGTQDARAARACVRDLLEHEYSQQAVSFVWLLGPRAMCFANVEDEDAELFALTPLRDGIRLWNLPSLEQLMEERGLKPQLWQQMQKLMPHWASHV